MEVLKYFTVFLLFCLYGNTHCISTYYLDEKCGDTITITNTNQIRLKATRFGNYDSNMDCYVIISADILDRIMIYFKDLSMESSTYCKRDNLTIYDGRYSSYDTPSKIDTLCGYSTPSEIYESSDDFMTIYMKSDDSVQSSGFDAIITQYHTGYCYTWETQCSNDKCIDDSIACNGYNSCGDNSSCKPRNIAIIVGSTVGGVVFLIAVVSIGVCIYCMKRRNTGRAGYLANKLYLSLINLDDIGDSCGDNPSCKPRNIAIIVGSTVDGVVFLIAVVSIGVFIYCMRRRNTGRAGYLANGQPVSTTFGSANMTTTNLGTQYNPPPGYNPNAYGMGAGQQYSTPIVYPQQPTTTPIVYPQQQAPTS